MLLVLLLRLVGNLLRVVFFPLVLLRRHRASPKDGWVHLELDGAVLEMAPPRSFLPWAPRPTGMPLQRLRELVTAMLEDPRPAGLLVTVRSFSASPAQRTAIAAELARLRAGKKRVVVHLPFGGSTPELALVAAADRVLLGATTTLGPLGFRSIAVYLRRALDHVGLVPDVHAEGAYKTAGEPISRDEMSLAQAEQVGRLLDVFSDELVSALVSGRGMTREAAVALLDRGLVSAADAVSLGLVDAVVHDDEAVHVLDGERTEHPARTVSAGSYLRRRKATVLRRVLPPRAIAVVELHGPIVERAGPAMSRACEAERVTKLLALAEKHPRIAAVVLHVDSPGGGVLASEKIHRAVARLAEKKPVIACFGSVSASGGYYVSAPAHAIVAQPTTITGSIGVVAARVLVGPLLERIGVTPAVVKRGAHADMMSPHRPFDDEERALFADELDRSYDRFLSLVADGRKKSKDEVRALAEGRVWAGVDALQNGLVDRLGGLEVAVEEARRRLGPLGAGVEPALLAPPVPLRPPPLLPLLAGGTAEALGLGPAVELASLAMSTRERVLAFWLGPRV